MTQEQHNPAARKIVMFDDPAAAIPVTTQLWQSTNGQLWANERAARYHSCTHRPCQKCGQPAEKLYTHCRGCRDVLQIERWEARPLVEWNGLPVWSERRHEWFSTPDDAIEAVWTDEDDETIETRLLLMEAVELHCRELTPDDLYDHFFDNDEDDKLPDWLVQAADAFNNAVRGKVIGYKIGKNRVNIQPWLRSSNGENKSAESASGA